MNKGDHPEVKKIDSILSLVAVLALCAGSALAHGQANPTQGAKPNQTRPVASAEDQIDVGVNFYQAMDSSSTAAGVIQTPSNAPGGMLEIRRIQNPLVGYEFTYSYNALNEVYAPAASPACGTHCSNAPQKVPNKANTIGFSWVFSTKYHSLRPFATGGVGFMFNAPSYSVPVGQSRTQTNTYFVNNVNRIVWLYGAGVDYTLTPHWGLRAQFRGAMYRTPNLTYAFPAQGVNTQTNMPMGGIFYAF